MAHLGKTVGDQTAQVCLVPPVWVLFCCSDPVVRYSYVKPAPVHNATPPENTHTNAQPHPPPLQLLQVGRPLVQTVEAPIGCVAPSYCVLASTQLEHPKGDAAASSFGSTLHTGFN